MVAFLVTIPLPGSRTLRLIIGVSSTPESAWQGLIKVGQIDAACHGEFVVEIRTAADPARRMSTMDRSECRHSRKGQPIAPNTPSWISSAGFRCRECDAKKAVVSVRCAVSETLD
jgi:hypothetical protein